MRHSINLPLAQLMLLVIGTHQTGAFQIRLVGGSSSTEGRVEVLYIGVWGTVCDDDWGIADAVVVCRELGLPSASRAVIGAHFGQGSGPIWLDGVGCNGSETALNQCSHAALGSHDCGHSEDAGVVCGGSNSTISTTVTTPNPTTQVPANSNKSNCFDKVTEPYGTSCLFTCNHCYQPTGLWSGIPVVCSGQHKKMSGHTMSEKQCLCFIGFLLGIQVAMGSEYRQCNISVDCTWRNEWMCGETSKKQDCINLINQGQSCCLGYQEGSSVPQCFNSSILEAKGCIEKEKQQPVTCQRLTYRADVIFNSSQPCTAFKGRLISQQLVSTEFQCSDLCFRNPRCTTINIGVARNGSQMQLCEILEAEDGVKSDCREGVIGKTVDKMAFWKAYLDPGCQKRDVT